MFNFSKEVEHLLALTNLGEMETCSLYHLLGVRFAYTPYELHVVACWAAW